MSISFKKEIPKKNEWRDNVKEGLKVIGNSIDSFTA